MTVGQKLRIGVQPEVPICYRPGDQAQPLPPVMTYGASGLDERSTAPV